MDLTKAVHLRLEAFKGFRANRLRLVRSVATVIGIALSMALMPRLEASIVPIKVLANYQLTDKQYKCHNSIITLESRWKINAVGNKTGKVRAYGYYQLKSKAAMNAPYDKQFELYWYYVTNRYGVTQYDEPNYCNALHHLHRYGWQ